MYVYELNHEFIKEQYGDDHATLFEMIHEMKSRFKFSCIRQSNSLPHQQSDTKCGI
jgi:hypothetical protein